MTPPLPLLLLLLAIPPACPTLDVDTLMHGCQGRDVLAECGPLMANPDTAAVVATCRQLVADLPHCIDAYQCLGAAQYTAGDLTAAMASFGRALDFNPRSPVVHANLALVRLSAGYVDGAVAELRLAVELDPGSVASAVMLADALDSQGNAEEATRVREDLLAAAAAAAAAGSPLPPKDAVSIRLALARAYSSQGRVADAQNLLLEASRDDPSLLMRHALGQVPPIPGSTAAIADSRRTTAALVADVTAALRNGSLATPTGALKVDQYVDPGYFLTYHGVNDEPIRVAIGAMYHAAFPRLLSTAARLAGHLPPLPLGMPTPAHLAEACEGATAVPPRLPRRIRVGFLSAFMYQHSVSKMMQRLVTTLPRALFHVTLFRFAGPEDHVWAALASQADAVVKLPAAADSDALEVCKANVEAADVDVLVYPELGMHRMTYTLAMSRLAPVQVSTHGNSETAGLPDTIDYFVSFDDIEADAGDAHYSEQLVRLAGFHSQFTPPMHLPPPGPAAAPAHGARNRHGRMLGHTDATDDHLGADPFEGESAFRLLNRHHPADAVAACPPLRLAALDDKEMGAWEDCNTTTLYLTPQTLYKLHPVFDTALARVLLGDPCGKLVLLQGDSEAWDERVLRRLAGGVATLLGHDVAGDAVFDVDAPPAAVTCDSLTAFGRMRPALRRVVLAPQRGHNAWLRLLAAADVVVDSYPFGGCTSSYEALLMGTPVVSTPSDALRGRFTRAILLQAGLEHFLAPSLDALPALAVQVGQFSSAQTPRERRAFQAELATQVRGATVMQDTAVHEWTSLLLRSVAHHWRWLAERHGSL